MTIILFLVDTSASMCQKAYVNGVQKSYLDIAKGAVETFLKYRQRSQDCMGDRYMLLTFEDPPANVKAGWKENHATFMNELKNLQSTGLTSMGEALRNAFDLLNLNRMQSGIDTYGQGRCPFYLEPSVIIVITDGGKYSFKNGVHQEISLPLNTQTTGAKLTKEPFRWDQRLFSLVLRMPGNKVDERVEGKVPHDDSPIEKMCEVTGGRSYRVKSHYVLNQCIESLVQKVQPGVVVHFDAAMPKDLRDGDVQDIVLGSTKKMIYVQKHPTQKTFPVGYWPIPEPYWPDQKAPNLPPRDAHPKIRIVTPCIDEPILLRNFPVDKYEVEASPLTLQILQFQKREPSKCWPVIVLNDTKTQQNTPHQNPPEMPFGYLKANLNLTQVHLMILPYNYLNLLPLLNELFNKFMLSPPSEWVYKFTTYVRTIPQYYAPFLRRALLSAQVPVPLLQYILPETLDNYLSPTVANYLKTMKNTAKQEQENMCLRVFKQLKMAKPAYHQVEAAKLNCALTLKRDLVTHPQLRETFSKIHLEINTYDNYTITVPTGFQQCSAKNYRNPFDVPRRDLIDEISRMRENFLRIPTNKINVFTKDAGHCLPISEMGNYQEYLKSKQSPLREIEPTNVRQHMFGNPYKKDKHMVMVDEADLGDVAPMKPNASNAPKKTDPNSRPRKRKAGPIRKDYVFKRLSTDSRESVSTTSSTCSSPPSTFDSDDDVSISDTSSTRMDDESENELVIDFDNDESSNEDFNVNGHVQSFINGDEEADEPPIIPPALNTLPHLPTPSLLNSKPFSSTTTTSPIVPTPPLLLLPPPLSTSIIIQPSPLNNGPTMPISPQNDYEAQEISKILQQCTNGMDQQRLIDHREQKDRDFREHNRENREQKDQKEHHNEDHCNRIELNENSNNGDEATNNGHHNNHHQANLKSEKNSAKIKEPPVDIDDLDDEQKENIKQNNMEARNVIFKDIRRPGRDYSALLDHLNMVKGNFDTKFTFIEMCINESLRFRRRKMADTIQEWWYKQVDKLNIPTT
ncbi:integrator complex subunit 6 [Bradysia coprophila]|uniref:integrator complex subunit 6 n=1 Tax=Bradysia coprophila TaxID=38358 RepID=UPI00187DD79D|nr:integrator complex subunit 6 [Bradysia coprophila]